MPVTKLEKSFSDRQQLIEYVSENSPWLEPGKASPFIGGQGTAEEMLRSFEPLKYGRSRNYLDGHVSRLSPYIRHGILSLSQVRHHCLTVCEKPEQIEKFLQELSWRDFWQRIYQQEPKWIWNDIEEYKTGYTSEDYSNELPEDISLGRTRVACIDQFISQLVETGYLHNHARMYLASYVIHWRRIRWQAGAKWFLHHLIDGDAASNNLSWQWVASTFSNKPYIFNLDNVRKYSTNSINTDIKDNEALAASYEDLQQRLFPNL